MKYENRELLEQLAGEYVVGTMRGRARRRFEKLCTNNVHAQSAVRRWEDRLMGLLRDVKPVQPPAQVWNDIERRVAGDRGTKENKSELSLFGWLFGHWSRASLAAAAAVLIGAGVYFQVAQQSTDTIGVFAQADQAEIWRINSTRDGGKLVIEATARVKIDPQHAYELWALPEGGAPVSLGLMPQTGRATLALSAAQRAALRNSSKIAISLEPPGGSPNGSPTQVLQATDLIRVG